VAGHGTDGNLRNIGAYIHASTRRYNTFKSQAGVALPQEQETRWNSWYLMLHRAVELRPFVVAFVEDHFHDLGDDYLSREDWEIITDTVRILQPFEEATRGLEGDEVTLDRVLPTMDFLIQHIQETQQRYADNRALSASLMNCWLVFDKYYALTEATPAYAAALLLHPSLKRPYMHRFWRQEWIEPAIQAVRALWERHYKPREGHTPRSKPEQSTTPGRQLSAYEHHMERITEVSDSGDEWEAYIEAKPVPIASSVIEWWTLNQIVYPGLSQMALDILSIPAMSAEPERVFSGARRTIRWDRTSLSSDNINHLECLKSWVRTGITANMRIGMADLQETSPYGEKHLVGAPSST
jgi:hypothetical protein